MDAVIIAGVVFLILGIILIGVEMIVPGFGVPGVSGIICIVAGIFMSAKTMEKRVTILTVVVVILAIMLTVVLVFINSKRVKAPIKLEEELKADPGYLSSVDLQYLVGKEGIASTDLRPTGKCDVDGIVFEVRSEGSFINKNTRVKIIKVQTNTLIVRAL